MLTKIVGNRVYDFSHSIGDPNDTLEPIALAVGDENELFTIIKGILELSPNVTRLSLGDNPGDERIVSMIGGGYGDDPGQFTWPTGVALDSERNVYVTDAWTDRVSVFTVDGDFIRSFGSSGDGDGQFRRPSGIAIDYNDNVLVVDALNDRVQKLTRDGRLHLAVGLHRIRRWRVPVAVGHHDRRLTASCTSPTTRTTGSRSSTADGGFVFALGSRGSGDYEFDHPSDVAVDLDGDIYVCDWANSRVQAYDSGRDVHHDVRRRRVRAIEVADVISSGRIPMSTRLGGECTRSIPKRDSRCRWESRSTPTGRG